MALTPDEIDRKMERYQEALKKVRTPAEMRRFMDDPSSDPELAKQIADAAKLMLRLLNPERGDDRA